MQREADSPSGPMGPLEKLLHSETSKLAVVSSPEAAPTNFTSGTILSVIRLFTERQSTNCPQELEDACCRMVLKAVEGGELEGRGRGTYITPCQLLLILF